MVPLLLEGRWDNILPMIWHNMNVMRSWVQLASVTKTGAPATEIPSIRGPEADRAAFVAAMHTHSGPVAQDLVAKLRPPKFKHFLDVGGASGTWTIAFLQTNPGAKATIFDLPDAINQAHERIGNSEFSERVNFVAGDFYLDELPSPVDFAWVSAIIHQHSREHNQELFTKIYRALEPGGRIAIRDMVLEPCRTKPVAGALFAINMLVHTENGGTFTFEEISADLKKAGFSDAEFRVKTEDMNSVVVASK